jgi:hypothetical protein
MSHSYCEVNGVRFNIDGPISIINGVIYDRYGRPAHPTPEEIEASFKANPRSTPELSFHGCSITSIQATRSKMSVSESSITSISGSHSKFEIGGHFYGSFSGSHCHLKCADMNGSISGSYNRVKEKRKSPTSSSSSSSSTAPPSGQPSAKRQRTIKTEEKSVKASDKVQMPTVKDLD